MTAAGSTQAAGDGQLIGELCKSARGELLERNDHRLRGAVHLDGAPGYLLLCRQNDRAADLLVDPDRLELDRLAPRHIEGREENREGRAAGIDRHLQCHRDEVAEIGGIGVDRVWQEVLGYSLVLVGERREAGIGADCVGDIDVMPFQCEFVCHEISPLITGLNLSVPFLFFGLLWVLLLHSLVRFLLAC